MTRGFIAVCVRIALRTRYARLARENLEHAARAHSDLPQDEAGRRALVRATFMHTGRQLREWMRLARGAPAVGPARERGRWIEELVQLDGSEAILRAEWERGRGVIVVTPHLGNWELLAARLRREGYDGAVIGLEKRRDSSARWLIDMRKAYDVETIPQDSSPREIMRILEGGQMLGVLPDLEVKRLAGEFLPFLGRPALTMTAPAALARARRVPLIPVRCVLDHACGHYVLHVSEPLHFDRALPRKEATTALTRQLNAVFETWITSAPEQWPWHQNRWRTQPGTFEAKPLRGRRPAVQPGGN